MSLQLTTCSGDTQCVRLGEVVWSRLDDFLQILAYKYFGSCVYVPPQTKVKHLQTVRIDWFLLATVQV